MKMYIIFIVATIYSCSYPTYNKLSEEQKKDYKPDSIQLNNHNIKSKKVYSIDRNELEHLVKTETGKYKLIYLNQVWCETDLNALKCLLSKKLDNFDIYILSGLDWIWSKEYSKFLDTTDFDINIYMMDNEKYPTQNGISYGVGTAKKYKIFLKEFLDKKTYNTIKDYDVIPTFYILNHNNELLYARSGVGCFNNECDNLIDEVLKEFYNKIKIKGDLN